MRAIITVARNVCLCGLFVVMVNLVLLAQGNERIAISTAQGVAGNTPLLDIQIEKTRSQLEAGLGLGVVACLTNNSDSALYIHEKFLTLTIPIEIEIKGWHLGRAAFFPTEWDNRQNISKLALLPGDSYRAFWTVSEAELWHHGPIIGILKQVYHSLALLFFSPGEYSLTVNCKYWTTPDLSGAYHLITTTSRVSIAAPQVVILLGAGLGGLIAFFLMPFVRRRRRSHRDTVNEITATGMEAKWWKRMPKAILAALGTILLSIIVTILLSRISDTQFFIQLTVNDFWGAIAVGFIAAFVGNRVIERIVGGSDKNESKTGESGKLPNNEM